MKRNPFSEEQIIGILDKFDAQINERWSLDFVSDQFTDGRRFRILTIVDDCTRENLALIADTSLLGARVARELDRLIAGRGKHRANLPPLLTQDGCWRYAKWKAPRQRPLSQTYINAT